MSNNKYYKRIPKDVQGRNAKKSKYKSYCRDCGLEQKTEKNVYFRAAMPRCIACGGILDKRSVYLKNKRAKKKAEQE